MRGHAAGSLSTGLGRRGVMSSGSDLDIFSPLKEENVFFMEIVVRVIISGNRKTASVVIDKSIFLESLKIQRRLW